MAPGNCWAMSGGGLVEAAETVVGDTVFDVVPGGQMAAGSMERIKRFGYLRPIR